MEIADDKGNKMNICWWMWTIVDYMMEVMMGGDDEKWWVNTW